MRAPENLSSSGVVAGLCLAVLGMGGGIDAPRGIDGARESAGPRQVEAPAAGEPAADVILRGAAVYTLDAARSWADAVAIADGRIVGVGREAAVTGWRSAATRVVDLAAHGGAMLLPGFHDSHVHPVEGGIEVGECRLDEHDTPAAVVAAVQSCARQRPGEGWLRGGGWQLPVFPDANPGKELLDEIAPDRPVFLLAADGHSAWVNSRALEIAGISAATADPPNGRIERGPGGEPTGTLRESAVALVARHLPPHSAEDYRRGLRRALDRAARLGITSMVHANADRHHLEAMQAAGRAGELDVRMSASLSLSLGPGDAAYEALADDPDGAALERLLEALRAARQGYHAEGGRLRASAVKIFADGVIEARTAALLEPYVDPATGAPTGHRGELNLPPATLTALATALDAEGFQIHVHAIGDRAIRASLDALEAARQANGAREARHHLAHVQLFDPADIPRFRRLGVAANFQPLWAYADTYIVDLTEPVLGPRRSRWLYPIDSLLDSGATVVCGSDWTVSSLDPLEAIEVAVTRRDPDAPAGPAWIPEETADLADMLACYTINGAWLAFHEDETGSIEPGKAADLVVLDRHLFEIPAQEISEARVLLTLVDGEPTWVDDALAEAVAASFAGR